MEVKSFLLWLFFVDIINAVILQGLFISFVKLLDNSFFANIIQFKKQILKLITFSTLIILIIIRLIFTINNNNQFSLAGTILLVLYFVGFLVYSKIKVKDFSKYNVLKLVVSFILTITLNIFIEIICVFVIGSVFNIKSTDILNNFTNTLLLAIPMQITNFLIILGLFKTNKEIIKKLIKIHIYNKKNLLIILAISILSISNMYTFVINSAFIDSLHLIWKYYYIISLFLTIFTMFFIFFWSNKNIKNNELSTSSKLSLLVDIMDNLVLTTDNITNTSPLQITLFKIINNFVNPTNLHFVDKKFDITYSTYSNFFKSDLQKAINNNKSYIKGIYTQKKYVTAENPLNIRKSKSILYIPLYIDKEEYGILMLEHKKANYLKEDVLDALRIVIKQIEKIIENSIFQNKIKKSANYDYLTKVYNRNYFNKILDESKNKKVSIMMLDIDFFKKVNDKYGHYAGDECLKKVAYLIKSCIRDKDILARYGGEEFIILFTDTSQAHLMEIGERIRTKIEKEKIVYDEHKTIKVTISIGISCSDKKGDINTVLLNADKALYFSKETGRNKCTIL